MAEDIAETSPETAAKRAGRSRVSNGTKFAEGLDGRTKWGRRYRDLCESYAQDMGGLESLSASQMSLVKRASALTVEIERSEALFAERGDTIAPDAAVLRDYQTACNSLRRLLESLGLSRSPKAVRSPTLTDAAAYLDGVRLAAPGSTASPALRMANPEARALARALSFMISKAVKDGEPLPADVAAFAASAGLADILEEPAA